MDFFDDADTCEPEFALGEDSFDAEDVLRAGNLRAESTPSLAPVAAAKGTNNQWQNYETIFTNAKAGTLVGPSLYREGLHLGPSTCFRF